MRLRIFPGMLLLALGAVSCSQNGTPSTQTKPSASSGSSTPAQPVTKLDPARVQPPVPPSGAQWTIWCDKFDGPAHVAEAGLRKSQLIAASGMTDWYVIHTETDSSLYYGYYRSLEDPAEKRRAESDRRRIIALMDRLGNPLVRGGLLQPVWEPDPPAPAAWNLLNTPKDTYWTVEVATFSGDAKRKQAAVDLVAKLRKQGDDAYYYHGPTVSSVCIGAWKRDAIAEQGTGINKEGQLRDDAHTQSAEQPLLVIPDIQASKIPSRVTDPHTGKPMTVETMKLDVQDDSLKQAIRRFPYHTVNYDYIRVGNGQTDDYERSMLVMIPHDQTVAREDDWRLTAGQSPTGQQSAPRLSTPSSAGDSVLKSIGDH